MVRQGNRCFQEFSATLGSAFRKDCCGEERFSLRDEVSEGAEVGSWLRHASTVSGILARSKRLLLRVQRTFRTLPGVGTQMFTVSSSPKAEKSSVACSRPDATNGWSASEGTSST